jgi:CxxC-x17-CxxC domain-containing protein
MPYEDKTLDCSDCNNAFTFTAGEQEFFAEREFTEPKRCMECRKAARQKKKQRRGGNKKQIYRSPAFEGSAPAHQKVRGRSGYRSGTSTRRGVDRNRSNGANKFDGEYRSPAFRDIDVIKPEQEYRAPGFREADSINPEEEYRNPGFQEYADIDVRAEYRAPGYQDMREKYLDEKPEFSITCSVCGKEALVPFLPEEREDPMCRECFAEKRKTERDAESEVQLEAVVDEGTDQRDGELDADESTSE